MRFYLLGVLGLLILWLVIGAWRLRSRRITLGPAAAASMEAMLDQDKRAAVEVVLEERAGARDPEDRDGNLPDLEHPRR